MTNNHTGDAAFTIDETLKRLGDRAPCRPTFMQAIKRGKLATVADNTTADGETKVSWASVEKYIAGGGFKPRPKTACRTGPPAASTAPISVPAESEIQNADAPQAFCPESSPPTAETLSASPQDSTEARPGLKQAKPRENRSARCRKMSAKKPKPTRDEVDAKARRQLPLRKLKNLLRHLDFDQTKNIRDWADNRLLNTLQPTPAVAGGNQDTAIPNHKTASKP